MERHSSSQRSWHAACFGERGRRGGLAMTDSLTHGLNDIVLFADDDPALCQLWGYLLSQNGVDATLATTGVEALAAASAKKPKIAILDMWMPRMSGLVVCRQLKSDPATSGMFVVIVSGDEDPDTRAKALEAGAAEFLLKPIDDDYLLTLVFERAGVRPMPAGAACS
ncbi:MAG: response regulator [Deltaproteobacteria bacterium]|nr:MAG: response regulator [Deltaproteobacteria bacterium]